MLHLINSAKFIDVIKKIIYIKLLLIKLNLKKATK